MKTAFDFEFILKAKASCRRPPKYKKYKKYKNFKNCQNGYLQKLVILEGFMQNGHHHRNQRSLLRIVALVKIDFQHFPKMIFFDMNIIKNCIRLILCRLGTMLKRFFEAKNFGLHILNPKYVLGNIIVDVSKMIVRLSTLYACCLCIMAMYHGYASWLCTMAMYLGL